MEGCVDGHSPKPMPAPVTAARSPLELKTQKPFAKDVLKQALSHAELAANAHSQLQKAIQDGLLQVSDVF